MLKEKVRAMRVEMATMQQQIEVYMYILIKFSCMFVLLLLL